MVNHAGYVLYDGNTKKLKRDILNQLDENVNVSLREKNEEDLFSFQVKQNLSDTSFYCEYEIEGWTKEDYLMIPAAVYAGNRFQKLVLKYPPFLTTEMGASAGMEPILTDVPGLSLDGKNEISITTADTACPCIGIFIRKLNKGILLFSKVQMFGSNLGIVIKEDLKFHKLSIMFSIPCVREKTMYRFGTTKVESEDKGWDFKIGEELQLFIKRYEFCCETIHDLYEKFFYLRKKAFEITSVKKIDLPLYDAFKIIEKKYNQLNWNKEGYYRVGTVDNIYQDWQAGWTGGAINTYPLIVHGCRESGLRAKETLKFILMQAVNENGFLRAILYNGKFYGDNFNNVNDQSILLIRKHCDAVYFLLKQYIWAKQNHHKIFSKTMIKQLRRCVESIVNLWQKEGQLGQFIDVNLIRIYAGGTASGAMAVGALALASQVFSDQNYLRVAEKIAAYYEINFLNKGILNGGPGEICQGCDSESAFGLLESYIVLYELTKNLHWLKCAEYTAWQCSSWCVTYAYEFPKNSCFGKRGVNTVGSVFANVQNKHSAPGICTLSGDSLLKLYRYTRKEEYLILAYDISSNITQYLSTKKYPIYDYAGEILPYGFMNERVNISDWEGKECVGGVFNGSCWAEISCMLTYLQIPGVYIDFTAKKVFCAEKLDVCVDWNSKIIMIENKRNYITKVKVLLDTDNSIINVENIKPITIKRNEKMIIKGA